MRGRSLTVYCARLACGLAAMLVAVQAQAVFIVTQPWVTPVVRGGSTEVYMDLTSTEGATLVGVASDAAAIASILGPGKASGKEVRVLLPPGKLVELRPRSYRIRLKRVGRSLQLGDHVMLTLIAQAADGTQQEIPVSAEVRRQSAYEEHRAQMHHH